MVNALKFKGSSFSYIENFLIFKIIKKTHFILFYLNNISKEFLNFNIFSFFARGLACAFVASIY
jgi:hypothetical protein